MFSSLIAHIYKAYLPRHATLLPKEEERMLRDEAVRETDDSLTLEFDIYGSSDGKLLLLEISISRNCPSVG